MSFENHHTHIRVLVNALKVVRREAYPQSWIDDFTSGVIGGLPLLNFNPPEKSWLPRLTKNILKFYGQRFPNKADHLACTSGFYFVDWLRSVNQILCFRVESFHAAICDRPLHEMRSHSSLLEI